MAKTTAPFLSMSARGSIGKTLVAGAWKGVSYMRQHVTPANPSTPAQVAQRAIMTYVSSFWVLMTTNPAMIAGWNLIARLSRKPVTGFNTFSSTAMALALTLPTAAFAVSWDEYQEEFDPWKMRIFMHNLSTGLPTDETGPFQTYYGTTPQTLSLYDERELINGVLRFTSPVPGTYFFQVRKDGVIRSGIFEAQIDWS